MLCARRLNLFVAATHATGPAVAGAACRKQPQNHCGMRWATGCSATAGRGRVCRSNSSDALDRHRKILRARQLQMSNYEKLKAQLQSAPKTWLITGVAGFIGSNLLEALLGLGQRVIGLDNFSTGKRQNLDQVKACVTPEQWANFRLIEADICDPAACNEACRNVDYVLHEAALGSVPRSIEDPLGTHRSNVTGFINMLEAARQAGVSRFIYASSSAVYGDDPGLPKREDKVGRPLSPYAATKVVNEIYAGVYARVFGLHTIGLRYFNVFGPRQDPAGPYAAVIPRWIAAMLRDEPVHIYGDGETSRDFCHIENIVHANLLAATTSNPEALNQIYNIAVGERTTLNELFQIISRLVHRRWPGLTERRPVYRDFRTGDVRHSLADISKAQLLLGYEPVYRLERGLELALDWYAQNIV